MRKLLFVLMIMGQFGIFSVVDAADYSGTYSMNGGNGTLTLKLNQQQNGTLTGELIGGNGYRISLNGEVTDGIGEGTASDSKGSAFFEVHVENGRLLFYLMEQNSDNGRSFYFTRVSGGVSTGSADKAQARPANPLQKQAPSRRSAPQPVTARSTAPAINGKTISDSQAGVTFTIPSGWTATQNEGGYLLVSKVHKGLIVVTSNPYHSVQELQAGGAEGIVYEKSGVQLMPSSQTERIGSNGLGGVYSGQVNGQAARAYVAGLVSPHAGAVGVTIIALTSEEAYDNQYPVWAKSIAASVRFSEPRVDRELMAWFAAKYWYHSSSSSSYGGISHDKTWTFCANGTFTYFEEDSASVTGTYGSASNTDSQGTWTIRGNRKRGTIFLTYTKPANFGERELEYVATGQGQDMSFEGTVFNCASRANCQ